MDIIECAYFRNTIYFEERKKMCVQWQKCEMVLSITLDIYVMKYVKLYALILLRCIRILVLVVKLTVFIVRNLA